MTRKSFTLWAAAILLCASAAAQNKPEAGQAQQVAPDAAASLPHDHHDGLTVLADPYTDKARAKDKFGKANPTDAGILPVEVFLRNETNEPIHVDINTIQLEVQLRRGGRQDIDWLTVDDVAYLVAHPGGVTPSNRPKIAGIPLPNGDKKAGKLAEILRPLSLDADVVPPMGALHGFLYFNVNYELTLADSAVLYVPDVMLVPTQKALMFFEVRFGKPSQP
ncbi:MAG: hypothetical protein WA192_19160 [Candidatus Acidiferrales bacterium]